MKKPEQLSQMEIKAAAEVGARVVNMRREQYNTDLKAVMVPADVNAYRVLCLRWALPHPPRGFEDESALKLAMHTTRLVLPYISKAEKLRSAIYVAARSPLPEGMHLRDGVLYGAQYNEEADAGAKPN